METHEIERQPFNGWAALVALFLGAVALGWYGCWALRYAGEHGPGVFSILNVVLSALAVVLWFVLCFGFFTLQPNISAVLTLFGKYTGTAKTSGFKWANPLYVKKKVSMRAHNLNGQKLKVNDLRAIRSRSRSSWCGG